MTSSPHMTLSGAISPRVLPMVGRVVCVSRFYAMEQRSRGFSSHFAYEASYIFSPVSVHTSAYDFH